MLTIHSADDVAKVIKEKTNLIYDVTVHYKEKTDEIARSIGKLSSLTGAMQIHEVTIGSDLSMKKKTFQPTRSSSQWRSRRAGRDPLLSLLWNKLLLNVLVSSYHHIIITSYLVLLHISKTLIHHCCIATSDKMTVGKRFPAK